MQGSMAEMVRAFVPRMGLSNIECSEVPQDEVRFRICDCNCDFCATSTLLVMGGVKMAFSGVEGETDLPFLPEGAGTPSGQGLRGTRGLLAVLGRARPDRALCLAAAGVSFVLVSTLDGLASRRRDWGRPSQCVGDQSQPKKTLQMHVQHLTGRLWAPIIGRLLNPEDGFSFNGKGKTRPRHIAPQK